MQLTLEWQGGMRFENAAGSPAIHLQSSMPGVTSPPEALAYAAMGCMLLSCAPIEGRISGVVDIPNACCTLALPTAIFEKSILPT